MYLSKISTHSCIITHYFIEENIFAVIVYKFLEQQMHWNVILKISLNAMVNKGLRYLQKMNTLDSKIMREK